MSKYTCISCRVAFRDAEIQRSHYKTDWHRYNLKRKVIELPPVTSEEFQVRIFTLKKADEEVAQDESVFCKVCRKSFVSSNSFSNHMNSRKHKMALQEFSTSEGEMAVDITEKVNDKLKKEAPMKKSEILIGNKMVEDEEDSEWEDMDASDCDEDCEEVLSDIIDFISENNPSLNNNCLFCEHHSKTMSKNLKHMTIEHSFFIPDIEYLSDMRGLLLYLGEKVCKYYLCLWCNLSGRSFYSMEAAQAHMRDKGHCKMLFEGDNLVEFSSYYNYSKSYPDHECDVDSDEEINLDELNLDGTDFQLKLPSGATIGHRSLAVYYKQYFTPGQQIAVRNSHVNRLISTYRALGWKGNDKECLARKARDVQFINRVKSKYLMRLGVKSNKLQRYFRRQDNC